MSYTLTIDEPREEAWFAEASRTMTPSEIGTLFVLFLRQRMSQPKSVAEQLESFVRGLPQLSGQPYRFRREDAYEETLA